MAAHASRNGILLPAAIYLEVNRLLEKPQGSKFETADMLHAFARFVIRECAGSETASHPDTPRLTWLLENMDPVELDAVLGRSASEGTSVVTADEARRAIDSRMEVPHVER